MANSNAHGWMNYIERFWNQVELIPFYSCWEWIGAKRSDGYGVFGLNYRRIRAHRFSYELLTGEKIPKEMQLDHLCRNPSCVNPKHLEIVTPKENYRRGKSPWGINAQKTHCKYGHPFSGDNLIIRKDGKKVV